MGVFKRLCRRETLLEIEIRDGKSRLIVEEINLGSINKESVQFVFRRWTRCVRSSEVLQMGLDP